MLEVCKQFVIARLQPDLPPAPGLVREPHLLGRIRWLMKAKWIGIPCFILAVLLVHTFGPYHVDTLLWIVAPVAVLNGVMVLYLRMYCTRTRPLVWPGELRLLFYAEVVVDLVAMALIIHYTGGVESPFVPISLLYVTAGALIFSSAAAYAYTSLVLGVLGTVFGLQYLGVLPHYHLHPTIDVDLYRNGTFVVTSLIVYAFLLYYLNYIALHVVARLRTQIEHRETIAEVSHRISSILDVERLLEEVVTLVTTTFDYYFAAVFLIEEEAGEVVLRASSGRHAGEAGMFDGYRQALGDGMIGWVAQTGRPLLANDVRREPRYLERLSGTRAELDVPLKHGERILGVLNVQSTERNAFERDDVETVQTLAEQVAVAIQNAQLYAGREAAEAALRRRTEELAAQNAIARAVSRSLELDEILDRLWHEVDRLLRPDTFIVALYDEDNKVFEVPLVVEQEERRPSFSVALDDAGGLTARVLHEGRSLLVRNVPDDVEDLSVEPDHDTETVRSWLGVPLITRDSVIGAILVQSVAPNAFSAENERFLTAIADQVAVSIENARLFAETQRHSERLAQTLAASEALHRGAEPDTVLQEIARGVVALGFHRAAINIATQEGDEVTVRAVAGLTPAEREKLLRSTYRWSDFRPLMQEQFRISHSYLIRHDDVDWDAAFEGAVSIPEGEDRGPGYWHPEDMLLVPLRGRDGAPIGLLSVDEPKDGRIPDLNTIRTLETFANQAAIAIENTRLYEQTRRMAFTDGLTGLYNVRHFYRLLEQELERSERYRHPLGLIMLDLDDFKQYNDRYGHLAGDELLKELANLIIEVIRTADVAVRYGGEEFAVILPETGSDEALRLAERLRETVEAHEFTVGDTQQRGQITVSAGVAAYPDDSEDVQSLVNAADMALLHAKEAGKNTAVTFSTATKF